MDTAASSSPAASSEYTPETGTGSSAASNPGMSSKIPASNSETYSAAASVRGTKNQTDPFAEQKNACLATWGTWISGTGCTWPSSGSTSTTTNTASKSEDSAPSDPVANELTLLRNHVEQATTALANAVAARDHAAASAESAKAALKEAQSTLLTSKETLESRKAALAQAESLLSIASTNLENVQAQYDAAIQTAQLQYVITMAQAVQDGMMSWVRVLLSMRRLLRMQKMRMVRRFPLFTLNTGRQ